jgi:hypothetical protein
LTTKLALHINFNIIRDTFNGLEPHALAEQLFLLSYRDHLAKMLLDGLYCPMGFIDIGNKVHPNHFIFDDNKAHRI